MLEVNQLTRKYGEFKAVDGVSFSIGKGEIVGLLGHNGAGKTTIMKMISGFLEPNKGSVKVDGVSLADAPKKIQLGLGYLPENLPIYPEMTVADYLDYAADLKGLQDNDKRAEIKRAVTATEIVEKLSTPIGTLSRGFKQRVGVAQAILGQPKLLILDEPTNGLDPEQTQHMRELICQIAQHATVILSTHIMQEVEAICHRVLMLRAGELVVDAKLEDLKRTNHLVIDTSMSQAEISALKSTDGVTDITLISAINDDKNDVSDIDSYSYRFSLNADAAVKNISAALGQQIFQAGHQIFRLTPEHRDLETLFREVNDSQFHKHSQQEVSHAA